jgi:hypothetical protein
MSIRNRRDIGLIFREGTAIDRAVEESVREAVRRHKLLGNPIIVWRDGKVVWVPPDEAAPEDDRRTDRSR